MAESETLTNDFKYLSKQAGAHITCHDESWVLKEGVRVQPAEEAAINFVHEHTDVPVPEIYFSSYHIKRGTIAMSLIPGQTLQETWETFDQETKIRLCKETWEMINKWRQIMRPSSLERYYQCLADGSINTRDCLLSSYIHPPIPLYSDEELRKRIHQCYVDTWGERYKDTLLDMLPRSEQSVFTHGDVAPQNIMVEDGHIVGVLDWELSGWYPDYWEYANIMKPRIEEEWQRLMDETAPQRWDLAGIKAARRVLF
ncbi:MAG: hypothetical protein Q9227_005230 [Pyrenula ochraceoflavens]